MAKPKILIVDDEKPTRGAMARILSTSCECLTAPDAELAMKLVEENPDLALLLTDYKMPGENGVSLIKRAKAANPSLACILITAFGEIELAVEAMKEGADDFITKPITDIAQMELRVKKALEKHALSRKVAELQQKVDEQSGIETFTGKSPAMEKVYRLIRQAAKSNANVLVEGPSGTGKELVAKALHDLSPRAAGPFVAVECAALSPTLIESELFGHEKGAFTDAVAKRIGRFEAANGGTIFLDEISEISPSTQVKLLRVLETRSFERLGSSETIKTDIRIVAACNRDLAQLVREGKFREDLYYRLAVIDIRLPALRERRGDIPLLVTRFLNEFSAANGNRVTGITPAAMKILESYDWPGNVRELRNAVERMVVLSPGGQIDVGDVPDFSRTPSLSPAPALQILPAGTLEETEKARILAALEQVHGNRSRAAQVLGISRRTLYRKLDEYAKEGILA